MDTWMTYTSLRKFQGLVSCLWRMAQFAKGTLRARQEKNRGRYEVHADAAIDWKQHTLFYQAGCWLPIETWRWKATQKGPDRGQEDCWWCVKGEWRGWRDVKLVLNESYSKEVASNARSTLPWNCNRTILNTVESFSPIVAESFPGKTLHVLMLTRWCYASSSLVPKVFGRGSAASFGCLQPPSAVEVSAEKPLYRPREWRINERAREWRSKRETWFKGDGYESVIFVLVTPGSELKLRYINKSRFRIKILLETFRSEDEDDYEYEFSILSMRIRFGGRHFAKCACSEQKTRTRSRPRPLI